MKRGTAVALLAVAFLLGAVVGALSVELVHLRRMVRWHHGAGGGPPEFDFLVRRLEHRLDLSPPQVEAVDAIVEGARQDLWEVRREVEPRVHRRLAKARSEIEEVLTEEQREELRRLGPALLPGGPDHFGHHLEHGRRQERPPG